MKICPKCHKEFSNEQGFCGNCGVKLEMKPRFCTKCGTQLNENDQFCPQCGAKTSDDVLSQVRDNIARAGEVVKNTSREVLSEDTVEKVKNTVGNAFSEENREKVRDVASEAVEAIKSADIEKGKAMATEGVKKIKKSKYGIMVLSVIIVIALVFFFKEDTSDRGQVKKIAESYAEFILKNGRNGVMSDSDIEEIVKQTEPELQKNISAMLNKEKEKADKIYQQIKSDKELEKKYEETIKQVEDADYEISEINLTGDKGYVIATFKNHPQIKIMKAYVVRKNDGKWYRGYVYFE